jgi:hypothetical protein
MASSGILRCVALVRTDVSEQPSASFIRVTRIGELRTALAVTSNRRTLRRGHGVCLFVCLVGCLFLPTKRGQTRASRVALRVTLSALTTASRCDSIIVTNPSISVFHDRVTSLMGVYRPLATAFQPCSSKGYCSPNKYLYSYTSPAAT